MTVKLAGYISHSQQKEPANPQTRVRSFRIQLHYRMPSEGIGGEAGYDERFPWTQRSEPADFHSWYILPWKNQFAVFL